MPASTGIKIDCTHKRVHHEHGTERGYSSDGCRCPECREAHRAYYANYKRQIAYGRSRAHQVDASLARAHVRKLMGMGYSVDTIVRGSGATRGTIIRLLYGRKAQGQPPSQTITARLHDKIMAYTPESPREPYSGTCHERLDPTGTRRRMQALIAIGYAPALLSKELGRDRTYVHQLLRAVTVNPATAEAVVRLYDRLWDVPPPQRTPRERAAVTIAKRLGTENGWPVPMAWDDDLIDLPEASAVA